MRKSARKVIGYMDKIDWDHEIGQAFDGNKVYPSIHALKHKHPCITECGIVQVSVTLVRVIKESRFG